MEMNDPARLRPGGLVLCAVILLSGCAVPPPEPAPVRQEVCWVPHPQLEMVYVLETAPGYQEVVLLPDTGIPEIDGPVHGWVDGVRAGFHDWVARSGRRDGEALRLQMDLTLSPVNPDIISMNYEYSYISGDLTAHMGVQGFVADIREGYLLGMEDILDLTRYSEEIEKEFQRALYAELDPRELGEDGVPGRLLKQTAGWTWSLTDREWVIGFQPGSMVPGWTGRIVLDHVTLAPYYRDGFRQSLGLGVFVPEAEREPLEPGGRYVALTFDDGPCPVITPQILEILAQRGIRATFFLLGRNVHEHPAVARAVAAAGHSIGNHTWNHRVLPQLGPEEMAYEIDSAYDIIWAATGVEPVLFRPPYGAMNHAVRQALRDRSFPLILWSVDSRDWETQDTAFLRHEILRKVRPGSIILLHDIHSITARALPLVLDDLEGRGYQFVTVEELVDHYGFPETAPVYGH